MSIWPFCEHHALSGQKSCKEPLLWIIRLTVSRRKKLFEYSELRSIQMSRKIALEKIMQRFYENTSDTVNFLVKLQTLA